MESIFPLHIEGGVMGPITATPGTSNHRAQIARHQWIAEAAYFKAEARQFAANYALHDWLEAEIEYAEQQVKKFLANHEEDQGMITTVDLQRLAKSIGIQHPENIHLEKVNRLSRDKIFIISIVHEKAVITQKSRGTAAAPAVHCRQSMLFVFQSILSAFTANPPHPIAANDRQGQVCAIGLHQQTILL